MRALVVDDDDFDRETCRRVLESRSWEVLEAATPEEAQARLDDEGDLDLVVSDYDLKAAKNGIDVLAHAQRVRPTLRRVLMSGLLPPNVLAPAQERQQVQAYIDKPDTLDEWEAALESVLPQQVMVSSRRHASTNSGASQSQKGSPKVQVNEQRRRERTREEALEERVRYLNAVVELGADAHRGASLRETFDRAVVVVSETLDMEYTKILELLPGGKEVLLVAGVGWKEGLVGEATVSTGMDSQAGYTLASKHPVIAEDLRAETRFSGPTLLHEHGVVSGLSVVIPGENGEPWGVFGAHTRAHRQLNEDHALFLRAVANVVAGAIARDRTEDTLRNTKDVLEREVEARTRQLRAAVDDLQAFNAMVAHDLRAPLRTVSQSISVFMRDHGDTLDQQARDLLGNVQTATGHMRGLLEDLLSLARATQDPLHMQDVDVTALARERWEHVRERTTDGAVRFQVEEGLGAHGDPRFLSVVLDNLLSNALKFTRYEEEPVIEVGAKHLGVGGTAFYVRDNGAGFSPELTNQLFHAFRRLHSTKQFEGTGIGLATVKRIVERHNGTVWAESEGEGKGATFYFRLLSAGLP